MAVGTGDEMARVGSPRTTGSVERRVFVHAAPRTVWAALHEPGNLEAIFPELRFGPATPAWPAAATTRPARARLGLLREAATVESLEARPATSFRIRVTASGFRSEWSWRLEPTAGGTRVVHAATLDPLDRWAGLLMRVGYQSLGGRVETHLRILKERAEASELRAGRPA